MQRPPVIPKVARFTGCLVGGAIGDAMGMPVETLNRQQIAQRYGEVTDFRSVKRKTFSKPAGAWTDDTYMTMLTAKSIIECGNIDIEHLTNTYFDALDYDFGVAGTTRQALELRREGKGIGQLEVGRHGGGGAAVRIAPVALLEHKDLDKVESSAEQVSLITHLDRNAIDSAVAAAFVISSIVQGKSDVYDILGKLIQITGEKKSNLHYNLTQVSEMLRENVDTLDGIEELGTDGTAVRLLPSALYAFLRSPGDFRTSVLAAVNAGGDTDTRAALTGAFGGAYNGSGGLPHKWLNNLQDHQTIVSYAMKIYLLTSD